MLPCGCRQGILWVPSNDGQQRRQAMAWEREEEIRGILGKRRWNEEEGRLVVSAYQASGKSLSSFAREYGLQPSRMWRWSARVRGEKKGGMSFHPVGLREAEPLDPKAGPMEVVLVNGRRVRVPQGFVAEDLVRVLEVLEGRVAAATRSLLGDPLRGHLFCFLNKRKN